MDTALMTFMIQTASSTRSVHLVGSWDNFTKHYPLERDVRRGRGQWRGCYAFEDIICDGDGGTSPKRTGGLKMGSTYYYYYELDDCIEHYDASIPFTTSCPFLPGQPLNLLYVPIEVQPLRYRSASMSSMANGDIKTMNPADKFMTPRPPPPTPSLPRLNTSTSVLTKKRSARSLSPKYEKAPWSPRAFFGLRSPGINSTQGDRRGRSSSASKVSYLSSGRSTPDLASQFKIAKSVPQTRAASPQSFKTSRSRDPSPLRQSIGQESYISSALIIPDEIAEEAEDDDNFAIHLNRQSLHDRGILTQLAPPPSGRRSPARAQTQVTKEKDTSKPLPQLPEEKEINLLPQPLRLRSAVSSANLHMQMQPRSHFSTSTISTTITSPTDSNFSLEPEDDVDADGDVEGEIEGEGDLSVDVSSGDEFNYSPVLAEAPVRNFSGYALPDTGSEQTLKQPASRTTFGVVPNSPARVEEGQMTALEQLLSEMGYLGDVIVGKS